jgi:hypothetical protein
MRWFTELDAAVAALRHLLASRGFQLVREKRLRRLLHQLEALRRGGTASQRHATKLIAEISQIVCEEYLEEKNSAKIHEQRLA